MTTGADSKTTLEYSKLDGSDSGRGNAPYVPHDTEARIPYSPPSRNESGEIAIDGALRQPVLAFALVSIMGLDQKGTVKDHVDAFNALLAIDVAPLNGWSDRMTVTLADLAVVAVSSVGNPGGVDISDPNACIDFLKREGISPFSVSEVFAYISKNRK